MPFRFIGITLSTKQLAKNLDYTHLPTIKRVFFKVTAAAQ